MKLGFIGAGNMASAMMKGIVSSGIVKASDIITSDLSPEALERAKSIGINTGCDNKITAGSDIVFLTVKPQFYSEVIAEIKDFVKEEAIVVTVAPGWTIERVKAAFGKDIKLIRTMPNTPAMVLSGMSELCPADNVSEAELAEVKALYESFGRAAVIPERLMDAASTVAGCSPAFVYMFIEALGDAGVKEGLPRAQAYEFAAQAVLGSAKMVLQTGLHPGALKDMVTSPAGTTIEGVYALEKAGFRSAVIDAVNAAAEKSKKI
ncbi:MAG: pyrroline-5-carboxylate reductase [Clostridia bacterium]|nr:pyrroline-5-carboxylate reductase [Clostridia bacterium]